ncbi:MAG: SDR family oxidoreductase [Pseudomonadota bacterium]
MDLGLAGKSALVCASSGGLGRACAEALAAEGVVVVINGRDPERLRTCAAEMELAAPGRVIAVAADVGTAAGRAALLRACPDPDILITNSGGPRPARFDDCSDADWLDAIATGLVAPAALIRAVTPGMRARGFGRIVNITSAMVTTPRPNLALSSGARAGLTAAVKGLSFELAPFNITINNLLPERFDSGRQASMARAAMEREGISWDEARARQAAPIAAGRLGRPAEFGATCAFICSIHAGYISGTNIHLDGGTYPALI